MIRSISHFVLCSAILAGAELARAEDWPTYMHDRHRTGVTAERLELPLSACWVYQARHQPQPAWPGPAKQDFWHRAFNLRATVTYDRAFHVVGTGDTVFFGSSADDKVYALDARTGAERWTFFTEGPIRLAPTTANGKVYVGSDDGCVYCLSADDGSLLWKRRATETERIIPGNGRMISMWPIRTGVLVDDGNLYFAAGLFPNQGAYLCALRAEDGTIQWKSRVDISPQGYVLASDERLYVPTGRTNPFIFARSDGRVLGELPSAGGTFALLTENVLVTGPGVRKKELNADDVDRKVKSPCSAVCGCSSTGPRRTCSRRVSFQPSTAADICSFPENERVSPNGMTNSGSASGRLAGIRPKHNGCGDKRTISQHR